MDRENNNELDEIKDDLSAFGVSVPNEDILKTLLGFSTIYGLPTSSLVEKYVAFRHNRRLSESFNQDDMNIFEKENLMSTSFSKISRNAWNNSSISVNALPEKMRNEVFASNALGEQMGLMSSYTENNPPKLGVLTSPSFENLPRSNTSSKSDGKLICTYSSSRIGTIQNQLLVSQRLPPSIHSAETDWPPTTIGYLEGSSRYMYQRAHTKADIIETWAWGRIKCTFDCLPDYVTAASDINQGQVSQLPRSRLSSALDASLKQEEWSMTKPACIASLFRPVNARLQSESLVAGRVAICLEDHGGTVGISSLHHQRLHPSNACLVGTRRTAGGDEFSIAKLDLSTMNPEYSLYPGQPVVLRATNPTGRCLIAFEFYQSDILPVVKINESFPSHDLHVAIACGPFTASRSQDISHLLSLLRDVKTHRPHVLILMGPIVDCNHPKIDDYFESSFEELYQSRLNTIVEWCHLLKIRVVVVSSWREAHGDPVFPTPPHTMSSGSMKNSEMIAWYKNVTFVWDPCTLKIGPYTIALSSPDVLFHMSSEEINANCTGDRLARLCRHVLVSGSFYPVNPPAEGLPIDLPLWRDHCQLPPDSSPHCLVLPSRLRAFVKYLDGVTCVNPGFVVRPGSSSAGSYARLILSTKVPCKMGLDTPINGTAVVEIDAEVAQL